MTTTTEAGGMEAGREPGQTAFEAYWQDDAHSAWSEGRVHADTKALWARVEAALATARPAITEDMIEAACRAAAAVGDPNTDADLQIPRWLAPTGSCAIWESYRELIEPALKAALDRAAIPQSKEAQTPAVIFGDPAKPMSRCSYAAPQSKEAE